MKLYTAYKDDNGWNLLACPSYVPCNTKLAKNQYCDGCVFNGEFRGDLLSTIDNKTRMFVDVDKTVFLIREEAV